MIALDPRWLAERALPGTEGQIDKNARGRLLVAGGSLTVPGALTLTGEAALRSGAGKVQLATVAPALLPLGVAFPEAAVIALSANEDGELSGEAGARVAEAARQNSALVVGPGMGTKSDALTFLRSLLSGTPRIPILLDAALLHCARESASQIATFSPPLILTPHPEEMASLMGCSAKDICGDLAERAAAHFNATIVLKATETWVASPRETTLHYPGGGPGLATAGSGDVLAGIIGGLLARGASAHVAAGWGVWAHGESGRRCAERIGRTGYLARDLLQWIPKVLGAYAQ